MSLNPDQRKYAVRLLAWGFHQRFPAHEGNPPTGSDILGAENALESLEAEFELTKKATEAADSKDT